MSQLTDWARLLGGEVCGHSVRCPGPGHSAIDRSLSVKPSASAAGGFVCYSDAHDDFRICRDYVKSRLGLERGPVKEETRPLPINRDDQDAQLTKRIQTALRIWIEAVHPRGTIVETYLSSRCLDLPDDIVGSVLRFHENCPYGTSRERCMVALLRDVSTFQPCGIQRTAFDREGAKLGRKMLGRAKNAAIMLDRPTGELVIGEGLETSMTARQLGLGPSWALGSAGAIASFPVLPVIQKLFILTEVGPASEKAVAECARRWQVAGRNVALVNPDAGFGDLNDEIMARATR